MILIVKIKMNKLILFKYELDHIGKNYKNQWK